jgi:hypothetical protein
MPDYISKPRDFHELQGRNPADAAPPSDSQLNHKNTKTQ